MGSSDSQAKADAGIRQAAPRLGALRLTFAPSLEAEYRAALRRDLRLPRAWLFVLLGLGFGLAPLYQVALFAVPRELVGPLTALELAVAAVALAAAALTFRREPPQPLTRAVQALGMVAVLAGVLVYRYVALRAPFDYPGSMVGVVLIAVAMFSGFPWLRMLAATVVFAGGAAALEFASAGASPAPQAYLTAFMGLIAVLGAYSQEVLSRWRWLNLRRLREASRALQESEARFEAFMEHAPAIAWIKDQDGNYLAASRSLRQRYRPGADWRGRSDADFFPAEAADTYRASDREVLGTGQPVQFEAANRDARGQPASWLIHKFPLHDAAGRRYVGGIGVELTERKKLERELREHESRFQAFLDFNPAISWMKDEAGRYLYMSASYQRFLGVKADRWRGRTDFDLFPREFAARCRELEQRVLETNQPHMAEGPLADHGGREYHWLLARFPFASASGQRFIGGVATDISERKAAERRAGEREQHLRAVQEAAPIGVVTIGRDGRFLSANNAYAAMSGYTVEELLKLRIDQLTPENERAATIAETQRYFAGQQTTDEIDQHLLRKDGAALPIHVRSRALHDEQGHVRCVIVTVQDLSARREAERAVRESEQRYRHVAESSPDQVWTAQPDGRLDYVNSAVERFSGWPAAHMVNSNWVGHIHPDDLDRVTRQYQRAIETGEPFEIEHRLKRADGSWRWTLTRAHLLRDGRGAPLKWFGTTVDIEDLKQARQLAEAATQAKAAFLANMSHEIRTPMNAVVGMTSILLDSKLTAEQREWTEVIRASGEHLLTVINDILDFSKIEAGRVELEAQPFALRDCVASTVELAAAGAAGRGIELTHRVADDVPQGIRGDVARLRQVLLNLLSNAIKFSPDGGAVSVEVTAQREAPPAGLAAGPGDLYEIRFAVRDRGAGLTPEQQARLFRPFTQADASVTRTHGGTGLGLSISKRLAETMGGRIWVDSAPGQGATFSFTILAPAAPVPAARAAAAPFQLPRELGVEHPLRILVAEDNVVNQKVARLLLSRLGYQADFVANGEEVLVAVERQVYDVVFMDVQMPVMDGIAATRELCRRYRRGERPRIVGMTANAMMEDRREAEAAGMEDYIVKPVTPEAAVAALRRCARR